MRHIKMDPTDIKHNYEVEISQEEKTKFYAGKTQVGKVDSPGLLDDSWCNQTFWTYEDAALQYRQAIQKSPSDWRLRWKYGKLLTEDLKDYEAAAKQGRLLRKHLPHSYLVLEAILEKGN